MFDCDKVLAFEKGMSYSRLDKMFGDEFLDRQKVLEESISKEKYFEYHEVGMMIGSNLRTLQEIVVSGEVGRFVDFEYQIEVLRDYFEDNLDKIPRGHKVLIGNAVRVLERLS
ncbi:hypothetical protein HNV12_04385 [Methanococcoides sp. SA1]|nr:hypothetical protein [Methanococcoides sp. SA1]